MFVCLIVQVSATSGLSEHSSASSGQFSPSPRYTSSNNSNPISKDLSLLRSKRRDSKAGWYLNVLIPYSIFKIEFVLHVCRHISETFLRCESQLDSSLSGGQ